MNEHGVSLEIKKTRWRAVRKWTARVSRWPWRSAKIEFRCRCGRDIRLLVRVRPGLYSPVPTGQIICSCGREYQWVSQVVTRRLQVETRPAETTGEPKNGSSE